MKLLSLRIRFAARIAVVWFLSFALVGGATAAHAQGTPPQVGARGVVVVAPRAATRRGGTIALGVFGGLFGSYGLIGLGVGFPLLYQERQARRDSVDGGIGCGSCVAIGIGASFTLLSTLMFVRVGIRTRAYRALMLGGNVGPKAHLRVWLVPSIAADSSGRHLRLELRGAF